MFRVLLLAAARLLLLFAAVAAGSMAGARLTGTSVRAALHFLPITILPGLAFILPRIWASRRIVRIVLHVALFAGLVLWKGWHIHAQYADVISLGACIRLFAGSIAGVAVLSILASACMPRFNWIHATGITLLGLMIDITARSIQRPYAWHHGANPLILAEILFFIILATGLMAGEWLESYASRVRLSPDPSCGASA